MKSVGIVRSLDSLGRIVLPIELRRTLELEPHDRVEIISEEDRLILRKYQPNCCFCGSAKELRSYKGRQICRKCVENLAALQPD